MANSNLEQLIATAALLRPVLGDLVFVGGAVTSLVVTDEGAAHRARRWMWTQSLKSAPTPNTLRLANAFVPSDSPKTPVKGRPCAVGSFGNGPGRYAAG